MPATVWKGYISFGLVSFPVRLFTAARAEGVHFHMLHKKDNSRIREVLYCAEEDKRIERSDVVKGFEAFKGHYVVIEDEELKKIAPTTATTMEILQFVDADEVDPIYFEKSYYVAPEASTAKPFALFASVLSESKHHAIAKLAMHNREHVVLIRPYEEHLILHTLFYSNELRSRNKAAGEKAKYTAKELELAKSLVSALTAKFNAKDFKDEYQENVERLISEKKAGKRITAVEQPEKPKVMDLMEALKQSLDAGKNSKTPKERAKHKATPARRPAAAAKKSASRRRKARA